MKALGVILGVILGVSGVIGMVASLKMDTTVLVGGQMIGFGEYRRVIPVRFVNNIGLVREQLIFFTVSGFVLLTGVVLFCFGVVTRKPEATGPRFGAIAPKPEATGPRCPECNGVLEGTPHVCRHCRSQLEWIEGIPYTPEQAFALREGLRTYERERQEYERHLRETEYQRLQEARQRRHARAQAIRQTVRAISRGFDARLRHAVGEENGLVYRFLQVLLYVVLPLFLLFLLVLVFL